MDCLLFTKGKIETLQYRNLPDTILNKEANDTAITGQTDIMHFLLGHNEKDLMIRILIKKM